jgi:hypothetical protein
VLRHAKDRDDPLSQWLKALAARKHPNVVIVALADKTARVAWAIVRRGMDYDPRLIAGRQLRTLSAAQPGYRRAKFRSFC